VSPGAPAEGSPAEGSPAGGSPAAPRVTAVCVVHGLIPGPKRTGETAIDKRPLTGAVPVGPLGLAGDQVCDTEHHGGVEQAVSAYADEDARWWAEHLQREIAPGLFGENLRTAGLDVTGAEIGERWRIGAPGGSGGVLLEVTSPRIPCITFSDRMGEPRWVRRFTERGLPGAYLAVAEPGEVRAGDLVTVEFRPGHGVTVGDVFRAPEPAVMQRLLDAEGQHGFALRAKLRRHAQQIVARA
jgi:MOSC domain-containing protein YiiM